MDREVLWLVIILLLTVTTVVVYFYNKNIIGNLKLHNKQLKLLSQYDDLTQIYNRRHFLEIVQTCFQGMDCEQKYSAIMMIDIDFFKEINDSHGHILGDDVLQHVVQFVRGQLRESDIFARYGGDEFIVFFPGIMQRDVSHIALRIQEQLAKCQTYAIPITLSIGICCFYRYTSLYEMIEYADKALYVAKNNGRNRIEFYQS